MNIEDAIKVLGNLKAEVKLLSPTQFEVGGFYKSGSVIVDISDNTITARYNEVTNFDPVDLLEELISLNYDWWAISKNRSSNWSDPDSTWEELLLTRGYVAKEIKSTIVYR